jgi:tetratricopeptide (TPR) repeat protein
MHESGALPVDHDLSIDGGWYQACFTENMTTNTPSLELTPLAPKDDASPAIHPLGDIALPPFVAAGTDAEPEVPGSDNYRDAATAEFEQGNIDQPLWDRALAQTKGDREKAIPVYLSARATALRLRKRDLRSEGRSRTSRATGNSSAQQADPGNTGGSKAANGEGRGTKLNANYGIVLVAACAGIVWCALLLYLYLGRTAPKEPAVAASPAPAVRVETPMRTEDATKTGKEVRDTAIQKRSSAELITRIDELKLADNWNVLVLYATEWTRLEPLNAAAWNQLSLGYEKLKQYDDAYGAATKAVSLAPNEALYWRNLGELDRVLALPDEALNAYGQAVALNEKDMYSLVQMGLLNLRLARMPEARAALDRALAASPEDPDVVCLKSVVARPPVAAKEFPGAAKHRESYTGTCRDYAEGKGTPVVASSDNATQSAAVPRKR